MSNLGKNEDVVVKNIKRIKKKLIKNYDKLSITLYNIDRGIDIIDIFFFA